MTLEERYTDHNQHQNSERVIRRVADYRPPVELGANCRPNYSTMYIISLYIGM